MQTPKILAVLASTAAILSPAVGSAQTVSARIAVGADKNISVVRVFDVVLDDTGESDPAFVQVGEFIAFHPRVEGARVAVGDVNDDGVVDVVVGSGARGRSEVKVVDGRQINNVDAHGIINRSALLADFYAFGRGFRHDVNVASGDVNNDGYDDVVVGPGPGYKSLVRVYDGSRLVAHDRTGHNALIDQALAFDSHYLGGVSLAVGDLNGDGFGEVIFGARSNSVAFVGTFDGATIGEHEPPHSFGQILASPKLKKEPNGIIAYPETFTGGVLVGAARVLPAVQASGVPSTTIPTIITGPSTPGDGTVEVFDPNPPAPAPKPIYIKIDGIYDARMFGNDFIGGVRVAAADVDGDGIDEIFGAANANTDVSDTINILTVDGSVEGGLAQWGSFKPFGEKPVDHTIQVPFTSSGFFVAARSLDIISPRD